VILAFVVGSQAAVPARAEPTQPSVTLEVFTREGCPHCAEAKLFLADLHRELPEVQIVEHDIWQDPSALQRLRALAAQRGVGTPGVPAFYLQGELVIGFAGPETTGARIKTLLTQAQRSRQESSPPATTCPPGEGIPCAREAPGAGVDTEVVEIPLLGYRVTVGQLGLQLFTFILGVLDGFNPCSMWVLILMLSMLASLKDRLKMVLIAGAFVAVEGIAYFVFMAAWLNLFLFVGLSRASEILLGTIACVAGMINLKDFRAFGWGISLSIPTSAKPGL
jgi:glutaredoxin